MREALDKLRITNAALVKAQIRRRREVAASLEQVLEGELSDIQSRAI